MSLPSIISVQNLQELLQGVNRPINEQTSQRSQSGSVPATGFHAYAELKLPKSLSAPSNQSDAEKALRAIVTATRLEDRCVREEGRGLLEAQGEIPALLKSYVWKQPKSELEALREIVRALPLSVGIADWREGIGDVVGMPKIKSTVAELSRKAKAILLAAAKDEVRIMHLKSIGRESIQVGGVSLIPDKNARTVALWIGGLEDLQRRHYIAGVGHKGEVFQVTREGFEVADALTESINAAN